MASLAANNINTKSIDIEYTAFNIITKRKEEFSQTFYIGMQIEHTSYYGICTIIDIDSEKERIYFNPQKHTSESNSWAFSTICGYLSNGTIIIQDVDEKDIKKQSEIDTRLKHETKSRCKDGHYVRSRGEKIIDDWLFDNRIFHVYEKLIYDAENDQELKPDFYLPDYDTYIEFWGLDTYWYNEKRQEKENYYNNNKIKYISIEPEHIDNIEDILIKKLSKIK